MAAHHGALLWIVSDGAAAVALEATDTGCGLEVWTEASGTGLKPGMALALGAAHPDLAGGFARGDHHIRQDDRYVLRQGIATAIDGLGVGLRRLGVEGPSIDHFIPTVSSLQVEERLKTLFAAKHGVPVDAWRTSFTRVGYVGGVGFLLVLDELARSGTLQHGDRIVGYAMESSKWICATATLSWQRAPA
jgi:3-oxoacyl-[acyl-carrier-protein] synthase-3